MQRLPGLTHIYTVPCSSLPADITYKALAGVPIAILGARRDLPILGGATLEVSDDPDGHTRLCKATLSFRTTEPIAANTPLAFIATTVSGDTWLIGTQEEPYPMIKASDTTGANNSPSVRKYTVTFSAEKAPVSVTI